MSDPRQRAELLAALHVSGAASVEEEEELRALMRTDPALEALVTDFRDSIAALASSCEPLQTSPNTLRRIRSEVERHKGGLWKRVRDWLFRA